MVSANFFSEDFFEILKNGQKKCPNFVFPKKSLKNEKYFCSLSTFEIYIIWFLIICLKKNKEIKKSTYLQGVKYLFLRENYNFT